MTVITHPMTSFTAVALEEILPSKHTCPPLGAPSLSV